MSDDLIYFNGIDGETGDYLIPPEKVDQLAAKIPRKKPEPVPRGRKPEDLLGLPEGVEATDVRQAGWGVIFHETEEANVQNAIKPLIEHRQRQIGNDQIVKVLQYRSGRGIVDFLKDYGSAVGQIKPTRVPYYLLIVGDPEKIPFEFGHLLDVEYSVGRLHFDKADKYEKYVQSVIQYETDERVPRQKEIAFFAPRNDKATQLSADRLVKPLQDGVPATSSDPAEPWVGQGWGFRAKKIWGADAKKEALGNLLRSTSDGSGPAFLFTAGHGMGWQNGHPRQKEFSGALVCQEWEPGAGSRPESYFAATDIPREASFLGMIAFHFACYGAGTPKYDPFFYKPGQQPPQVAPVSFLSSLPCSMLSHPNGAVLASIGHVDRAHGYSFIAPGVGDQLGPFQNAIKRVMRGFPVGYAMHDFHEKFSSLSAVLGNLVEDIAHGMTISDEELASMWLQRNDFQSYVLLGDPAVRLRIDRLR